MTFVAIDKESEKPQRLNPMKFELEEFEDFVNQNCKKFISADENIFHNVKHIKKMISQLKMYKSELSDIDYKRLYIAICYHDSVCVPANNDNKEKSIEIFKKDFCRIFSEEEQNKIIQLIKCTKTCSEIPKVKHGELIHDLNLLFYMDYEKLRNTDIKIRTEHSQLTPLEYYEYRLKYFKELTKSNIYISEYYEKFNSIAIKNIKKYMKEIKELIKTMKTVQTEPAAEELVQPIQIENK